MKLCKILSLAVLWASSWTAWGQSQPGTPPPPAVSTQAVAPHPHSLSLHADRVASGGSTAVSERNHGLAPNQAIRPGSTSLTFKSSQEQVTSQSEALKISVRNLSALPDTALVEWFFIAGPVKPAPDSPASAQEYIFDKGSKIVTLKGNGWEDVAAQSSEVASVVTRTTKGNSGGGRALRHLTGGAAHESGTVLRGWVVRLSADQKLAAVAGSKQTYEDLAKDLTKLPIP